MELMRDYIDIYCSFKIKLTKGQKVKIRNSVHIVRLTDDFKSFDESTIKIERDGVSGTMTSIAYQIAFAKTPNSLFLKSACEAFMSKDNTYTIYDELISKDTNRLNSYGIESVTFESIFKEYDLTGNDLFIDPKDVKVIVCFAKDNSYLKPVLTKYTIDELRSYSGYQRVVVSSINFETYTEDLDYINFEASAHDLQKYLKSKGDFKYDIPVEDLADNLEDILFQHRLDIPVYTEHTPPKYNQLTDEGVKQRILSIVDRTYKDEFVYYLPSIRWDDELVGMPKEFKSKISFGSQRGENVYKYLETRDADEYLIRNVSKKSVTFNLKCNLAISGQFRGSAEIRNYNPVRHMITAQLLAVKDIEIKKDKDVEQDIYGGNFTVGNRLSADRIKVIGSVSFNSFFERIDNKTLTRYYGYWSIGSGLSQYREFNFDKTIKLEGEGGFNTLIFVLKLNDPEFEDGRAYSSCMFFNNNNKITTTFGDLHSDDTEFDDNIGGFPVVKGIRPHYIVEHIIKNKWNKDFKVNFMDDFTPSVDDKNYKFSSIIDELGSIKPPIPLFIASESLSYKEGAEFHITVLDIIDWFRVKGYEYSIIDNETMLIAPRQYFYDNRIETIGNKKVYANTISYDGDDQLFEQGSMEISINSAMCYTDVLYGFNKEEYDIFAGAYDPVSAFKYDTTYISDEGSSLELTTDIKMDFYGMYYLLYRRYSEETDKTNEHIFALDCKLINTYDKKTGARIKRFEIWDYAKAIVTFNQNGLKKDITYYNALNVPSVAIWLYNLRYFRIFARNLLFVSSENYTADTCKIVVDKQQIIRDIKRGIISPNVQYPNPLLERDAKTDVSLIIPVLNDREKYTPHFMLGVANVKVGTLRKLWMLNGVDTPNKILRFIDNENIVRYGFIKDYEYNLWDNESSDLSILIAKPKLIDKQFIRR